MWPLIVAILLALALAVGLLVWYGAERLTARRPPSPAALPGAVGLPIEKVSFNARDGTTLCGYWIPPPHPTDAAIVICPGLNGSAASDLPYAALLRDAGYGVLLFDFRAHGRSAGERVSLGWHERGDLLGAVDWLTEQGIERVGALGLSMGGAVAISAAPEHTALKVVVADGAFAQVHTLVEGRLREMSLPAGLAGPLAWLIVFVAGLRVGGALTEAEPLRHVGQLSPRALLLIHGARDIYVPIESIRRLYSAARSPKALWIAPEAGHREVDRYRPDEYRRRVVEFFHTYL